MRTLICLLAAMLLVSCATGYQPSDGSTGYSDTQLQADTFRVKFSGNSGTSHGWASDMVLLRSAQLALDHGFAYFVIVDSVPARKPAQHKPYVSLKDMREENKIGADTRFAMQGFDLYDGKPEQTDTIRCYTRKPETGERVFDARETFNRLAKMYKVAVQPK